MLSNEIPSPNQEEKRVIIVKNSKSVIFDRIWQFAQQLCIKIQNGVSLLDIYHLSQVKSSI